MTTLMANQQDKLKVVTGALSQNWPVLLEGVTGCGKNVLLEHIAKQAGKKIIRLNLNVNVTQEDIWGQNVLVKDGDSSIIKFKTGPVVDAVTHGHWLLLDEVNAALPEVLFSLHALLEKNNKEQVYIPILQEEIVKHSEFRILATMNPSDEYFGVRNMNQAFLNRFMIFKMREPELSELHGIYRHTNEVLCQKTINLLVSFRKSVAKWSIHVPVSARDFEKIMTYVSLDYTDFGIEQYINNLFIDSINQIPEEEMKNFSIKNLTTEESEAMNFFMLNISKCKAVFNFMKEVESKQSDVEKTKND